MVVPLLVAACVPLTYPVPAASPIRTLGPGEIALPTVDWGSALCAGVGFVGDFRVHGSPDDPRLVWLTKPDGTRVELAWDPGTSARFTPDLEILGPSGEVIAQEGSLATGGCGTPQGAEHIGFETPAPVQTEPRASAEP